MSKKKAKLIEIYHFLNCCLSQESTNNTLMVNPSLVFVRKRLENDFSGCPLERIKKIDIMIDSDRFVSFKQRYL